MAVDDFFSTDEDMTLNASDLSNDQGQSLAAAISSGPFNGSVTMNSDGSFTYTPNANYYGSD